MKRKLLLFAVANTWFSLVFLVGLWLTFPSDAVVKRLAWEVQQQSDGTYALSLDSVSPWWAGLQGRGLQIAAVDPRKADAGDEDAASTLFAAETGRVRVGLLSLLSGAPRLFGRLSYGAGALDVQAVVGTNDRGGRALDDLQIDATDFPITSLPPMGGVSLEGTGDLDLHVELDAREGMRKANGRVTLLGENLDITKLIAPDQPMLAGFDMAMHVTQLDLVFDVVEGRARVQRGKLDSNLVQGDISGDISLLEDISRSRLRLQIDLHLGEELKMFKGLLKDAAQPDGSFRYRVTGTFANPRFLPDRARSASNPRPARKAAEPASEPAASSPPPVTRRPPTAAINAAGAAAGDERPPVRLPLGGARLAKPAMAAQPIDEGDEPVDPNDPNDPNEPDASDVDPADDQEE